MKKSKGVFIVLEGIDGSGKSVQLRGLLKRLKQKNFSVKTLSFPRYGQPSSYFIKQYLRGFYGTWEEVGAYKASLFYALDRFAASADIRKWLKSGNIVISDRYVASNLGHQGVKIKNKKARQKFFSWVNNLEYNLLSLPKPDMNIFLHVPAKIAYLLIGRKRKREYLRNKKRDIHERDISHLKKAEKVFNEVANLFPKDFVKIECAPQGKLLTIKQVEEKVWQAVEKILNN